MVETKSKTKLVKLLGSIVLGLAFLYMCFVGLGISINKNAKAEGEELASIYVDSGATTNITGGSVGAMESGNSVYVADGGTLNVTGGTVSGNIYNGGTLNYTAGTLNSVTLASGKYITFKGNPSSTISITLDSPSVGTNIGYLDGITSVTLSRLSVTNLPSNTKLRISGNYITIAYVDRTVSFAVDPSGYGTVSQSTLSVPHGSSVSVSGSTLSYGSTSITATPAAQTAQYTYSFAGWYVGDTQITSSRTITANTTITARFTRTTRTYTVTITRNNTSYGTVSRSSVTNVPYGATIRRGSSSTQLIVDSTTVTATPASSTSSYTYSFSSWRLSSSSGTTITTTGITLTGDTTIYAVFSRASVPNYYANIAPFYGPSTITSCKQGTEGTVGGTVSFVSYPYQHTITEMGKGRYLLFSNTRGTANIRATAKAGYTFAGWYDRNTDTTPLTTSATYTIAVTTTDSSGAVNTYFALFKATTSTIIANMFNPYDVSSINHQAKGNNFEEAETVALNNTELFSLNLFEPFILSSADQIIIKRNKQID